MAHDNRMKEAFKSEEKQKRIRVARFFHSSRPLDEYHGNLTLKSVAAKPPQDYDPVRFLVAPRALSCSPPLYLPVSFRCYGRVCPFPRPTLSSGKAVRSKLDCMHEPPFSPTAAPHL